MTLNKIISENSAISHEQLHAGGAGQQVHINKAMDEFYAEEKKTWNLQVKLVATALLSIVYLAVSAFN
jgi:hypothetical protein